RIPRPRDRARASDAPCANRCNPRRRKPEPSKHPLQHGRTHTPRQYIIPATPPTPRPARLEWSFDSISVRAGNNARQTSEGTSMKTLVGYKRVVDYNVRVQVRPDGSGVVTDGVKLSANPFDEIALEEALRLREAGVADEVVIAGIGPDDLTSHLRNGLAMGADRAIHVSTDAAIQP